MRRTVGSLMLSAALLGAVAVPAGASRSAAQIAAGHRQLASSDAVDLLTAATLPAGAMRVASLPDVPFTSLAVLYANEVDRHVLMTTTVTPDQAQAAIRAGLPPGTRSFGVTYGPTEARGDFTIVPPGGLIIGHPIVGVDAVRRADGTTAVRIDAFVRYRAPRLVGQFVPATVGVLTVTRAFAARPATVDRTVRGARVAQIARLVDALPLAARFAGRLGCPFIPVSPVDTFVFRAADDGPVLARVTASASTSVGASPCSTTSLHVTGHAPATLLDGGRMLRRASTILGVGLVARPGPPGVAPVD